MPRPLSDTCRQGHPWTAESTYTKHNGHRECRICRALRKSAGNHRKNPLAERRVVRERPASIYRTWPISIPAHILSKSVIERLVYVAEKFYRCQFVSPSLIIVPKGVKVPSPLPRRFDDVVVRVAKAGEVTATADCWRLR